MAYICRKIRGSGSVRSGHQTFRRLEKLVLPSIFDTSFFLHGVKFTELSNNYFEWKNVTFWGLKTYSDPSYIFSGGQDSTPRIYAPVSDSHNLRSPSCTYYAICPVHRFCDCCTSSLESRSHSIVDDLNLSARVLSLHVDSSKEWHGSVHQPHPHPIPTKISPSPPHPHQLQPHPHPIPMKLIPIKSAVLYISADNLTVTVYRRHKKIALC